MTPNHALLQNTHIISIDLPDDPISVRMLKEALSQLDGTQPIKANDTIISQLYRELQRLLRAYEEGDGQLPTITILTEDGEVVEVMSNFPLHATIRILDVTNNPLYEAYKEHQWAIKILIKE